MLVKLQHAKTLEGPKRDSTNEHDHCVLNSKKADTLSSKCHLGSLRFVCLFVCVLLFFNDDVSYSNILPQYFFIKRSILHIAHNH